MSRYSQAAAQERAMSQRGSRETAWPLPLKGIYSEAARSELAGVAAEVMHNWQSNGVSLKMRNGFKRVEGEQVGKQRIPYTFRANAHYISITATQAFYRDVVYNRAFPSDVAWASLSSNIVMADGAGPMLRCDGTTIQAAAFTTSDAKDPDTFDGLFAHHDRLYAWDSSELAFYYGDVGAVMGVLTRFPLDQLGNITGNVEVITSMTVNASHGMNDILIVMTSTGMVILYEGLNPGDFNDWRLLGRVATDAVPVSKFAVHSFGSDTWIVTNRGVISIRDSLTQGVMALASSITRPVADMIAADVRDFGDLEGWGLNILPEGMDVVVNVPTSASTFKQYIYSAGDTAWTTADYPAKWWHTMQKKSEFSLPDQTLGRITRGGDDDGTPIIANFYTSWVRMPHGSILAYLLPTIIGSGNLVVTLTVLTDHHATPGDIAQATQTITLVPDDAGSDVALSDIIGVSATGRVYQARFTVTGSGVSFENLMAGLA